MVVLIVWGYSAGNLGRCTTQNDQHWWFWLGIFADTVPVGCILLGGVAQFFFRNNKSKISKLMNSDQIPSISIPFEVTLSPLTLKSLNPWLEMFFSQVRKRSCGWFLDMFIISDTHVFSC